MEEYSKVLRRLEVLEAVHASRVRAKRSTVQSIPNATLTIMQYNIEDSDNLGEWDAVTNFRFQPKQPGDYWVDASFMLGSQTWAAGKLVFLLLAKDGVEVARLWEHFVEAAITGYQPGHGGTSVYLTPSNYADIQIYQDSGGAVNLINNAVFNYMAIHRLS